MIQHRQSPQSVKDSLFSNIKNKKKISDDIGRARTSKKWIRSADGGWQQVSVGTTTTTKQSTPKPTLRCVVPANSNSKSNKRNYRTSRRNHQRTETSQEDVCSPASTKTMSRLRSKNNDVNMKKRDVRSNYDDGNKNQNNFDELNDSSSSFESNGSDSPVLDRGRQQKKDTKSARRAVPVPPPAAYSPAPRRRCLSSPTIPSPSSLRRKSAEKARRTKSVRFDDKSTQLIEISQIADSDLSLYFYDDDELAEFRYEAFMEKVGLDPAEFD